MDNRPFYDAVTCVLSCALQADSEIQRLAEERIKALEMVDDYPFTLVEIIASSEEALAEKHMASIFLKNYFHDIYTGNRQNEILQNPLSLYKLCGSLIDLLRLNFVSIKTMIAETLSYIVYKGGWAIIDHRICPMLKSNNEEHIHNVVFFLKQCMSCESHIAPFKCSPEYFELLLSILQRNTLSETRSLTLQPLYYVICYCSNTEVQENALSRLGIEFYNCLSEQYSANSDFKLKSEIIKYITKFEALGPTSHCHIVTNSLPAIGQLMTSCRDQFKQIIKQVSSFPKDCSEQMDDESSNFIDLITLIIKLIKSMVFSMYFELLLEDLDNLLRCLFIFMCCYDEMEEEIFLENEFKSQVYLLRTNAAEILKHIEFRLAQRKKGPEIFYKSINTVFHNMMEEVQMLLATRQQEVYQARVLESLMYGLGYINYKSVHYDTSDETLFPYGFYLDHWTVLVQTSMRSNSLVIGRLLWLGGVFSRYLSSNLLSVHLKVIIQNLNGESSYLYVPSTEALRNHMITYNNKLMPTENQFILKSLSSELLECLLTMIQKMNNPTSCLNALGIFIKLHEQCVFTYIHNLQETLVKTIHNHLSNNAVMQEVNFILGNIAAKENLQEVLHQSIVPFLCKLLHGDLPAPLVGRKDAAEKALEFLSTIAVHTLPPISETLMVQGFSGAARLMLDDEYNTDRNMNEAAANFITTLLLKMTSQMNYLRNSKEMPLSDYIPKIIFGCIGKVIPISGLQLAKLCVVSINTLPSVLEPNFESILKSVLSAIQTNKHLDQLRGLWVIFIYILMCRPGNTANFLSSIPGPDGGSALNYLLNIWQPEFVSVMSKFERTVLCMALVQVITAVLDGNADKLKEIDVQLFTKERGLSRIIGVEYLYLLLVFLVLMEQGLNEEVVESCFDFVIEEIEDEDAKNEDDEILLSFSPLNINIIDVTSRFLKHDNIYYSNVCRNYLYDEELIRLSKMGCIVPQVSME
ncbi:hypothetical protein NQ315_015109 [Exocentrus adspersus]|uniref:Importin N-terminal domain-containing protein n=1 Tax=Exocentrus adspersus TaxID=1586481 RepID=A0AAV8VA20_9CUCU|nr:hypothetical protein NQ315_015109 [Exocentrus adspersus]